MGLRLSDYINEDNSKLNQEQIHDFVIDYGFTDLQLTKDNSIQSLPLSNEAYEKALDDGEDTTHHIPHLTNININDNTEEPMKFIKRIAKERD
ncbi:hypothetical protein [Staphylococcus pseudoxylosus]|uniref:hypothetical protein n=1 Tax=Staphylococcus pseudoxylosus TaxID=2282419 RepID=UPI002DBA8502|nr:hypothetical protein [Staphylococcus pseudoxylosus]MEB7752546.1 hypothetical protein [Staphylococcus pseudoxylosus]